MGLFSKKVTCEEFGEAMVKAAYQRSLHAVNAFLRTFFGEKPEGDVKSEQRRTVVFRAAMTIGVVELMTRSAPAWASNRIVMGASQTINVFQQDGLTESELNSLRSRAKEIANGNHLFQNTGLWSDDGQMLSENGVLRQMSVQVFTAAYGDIADRIKKIIENDANLAIPAYDMLMASRDIAEVSSKFQLK